MRREVAGGRGLVGERGGRWAGVGRSEGYWCKLE